MKLIKIGTLVPGDMVPQWMPKLIEYGFEAVAINYFSTSGNTDFKELAKKIRDAIGDSGITVSSAGVYCNPLRDEAGVKEWIKCIDHAEAFGTDIVTGFTGRLDDVSVPDNIPRFKEVFTELAKRAADKGVKLAFENCAMGSSWHKGTWNISNNPLAWDMMFDVLPFDNVGLEWEAAHQLSFLRDPLISLRKWAKKIFHVHGKDANIDWYNIREFGIDGARSFARDRTPGFGDTDWREVCNVLYRNGYEGTIAIEGFHDPFLRENFEFTGQVAALKYLKECRGGDFIANP